MTSGACYDKALESMLEEFSKSYLAPLANFKPVPIPDELTELLICKKNLQKQINDLSFIKIPAISFDAVGEVNKYYDALDQQSENEKVALRQQAEVTKQQMQSDYEQEIANAQNYNDELLRPIQEKHAELLSYRDDLSYVFEHYDITPLDIDISDNVTIKEFGTLVDESLATCIKYMRKDAGLFSKLTDPLKDNPNLMFTLGCSCGALLLLYVCTPILAIPAFVLLFMSVHNMYKDLEKLRIASALMTQLDYKRFVPEGEFVTVQPVDTSGVDEKLNNDLALVKDYGPDRDAAMKELAADNENIAKKCQEVRNMISSKYAEAIESLNNCMAEVNKRIEEKMKDYKPFPTVQNNSVVMSHSYALGRFENRLDVYADLPVLNIVFNSGDRECAIDNMKLYLANALLSVRVKQLTVEIYDPKNMCADFTEFFTPETKPYIKPNMMSIEDLVKTYRKYSQENVITLDRRPIDEYNKEAEEKEMVPKAYKLLLFVSELDKLEEGENKKLFTEYFKFSASTGVMIWLLDNKEWANSIWVDGSYSMKGEGIKYTRELGKQAVSTYVEALAKFKDTGIDYVTKYGNVFIPQEKWWTWDTIKGIIMPYGLEGGDPTRGLNVSPVVGDANVHSILGGATGAGKSAEINQHLISLITMYPPSELQIVYIDFKNVEAAKFTAGYDKVKGEWMNKDYEKSLRESNSYYSRLSRIPHLRIISGTTDGEYALSVFEFLMQEMANRQKIINKFGVTKIQEMREQILAQYNLEHNGDKKKGTWADMRKDWDWYKPNVYDKYGDLPRLLVIFDEFQVMYNPEFVDNRIIDQINGKITAITKLARAMGTHFWFTSQSMKGTMSKDTMANFSLRGALRCTKEVSEELIGNVAAGLIQQKFGFMYTNDTAGTEKEANRLWRVPFLDEKAMPGYIDKINDMLEPFNEKHCMAEFYDEKILVPSVIIDEWYDTYPDKFKEPSDFILGERADYSTNKAPVTITLLEDGGENIMLAAFDRNDMLNLVLTLIDNIRHKGEDCSILMNVQDKETHLLLDVENIVPESFLEMSYPSYDIEAFVENFEAMVAFRNEKGGPYKPVYVFCVQWERAPYISVDINYKIGDRFKDVIRKAPSVGIHFIFASREKLDMQRFIPAACNHRICGLLPKDASFFIETIKVEKLPDASKDSGLFAIYEFGKTLKKFRIYQHTFTKTIPSREIVI